LFLFCGNKLDLICFIGDILPSLNNNSFFDPIESLIGVWHKDTLNLS